MSHLAVFGGQAVRTRPYPSWPVFDQSEEDAVLKVLRSGKWWRCCYGEGVGDEPNPDDAAMVTSFQTAFAKHQGAAYGVACANGTAALEIALKALGIGPGDEVIVPPYTFVATATAPLAVNAVPVFADIDNETFNLDPDCVERAITPRTRAIVPVHFAGTAADMGRIMDIAKRHKLFVVEDSAHGHGATWNGRGLGTIGNLGTFSFQASKNMTAGEGGVIVTDDASLRERCESFVWGGRADGRPWYEHHRLGWNYRLTEFQGAILLAQLKRLDSQNETRMKNAAWLNQELGSVPGLTPQSIPDYATRRSVHIYMLRFNEEEFGLTRDQFIAALQSEGIPCSPGYAHPLYRNPMFVNQQFYTRGCPTSCSFYGKTIDYTAFAETCPNSEQLCKQAVWLEHRMLLGTQEDMGDIVRAIHKIRDHKDEFKTTRK